MLAKPEKNVRSAFTTSTVVRMHVGDAKKAAKTAKPSSSMANLFRRRGSTQEDIRYGGYGLQWRTLIISVAVDQWAHSAVQLHLTFNLHFTKENDLHPQIVHLLHLLKRKLKHLASN